MADSSAALQVEITQQVPISLQANFHCAAGEVLALVGPSGSGKSTILKAIAGLYQPKKGCIKVGGHTWLDTVGRRNVPPRKRSVGMVFQDYALFPHLTALDNITEAMQHVPIQERNTRAEELLKRVHMAGLANRRPANLSGGQQQRIAVARALARDPAVLLLDEPFSAVDQVTKERLYEELAALRQHLAIPIVLVTHSLQEASLLADKMCVLHRGKTLQLASPAEVMCRPASIEVARLVALRNVFTAEVEGHRESQATLLRWGEITLEAPFDARFHYGERVYWAIPDSHVIMHRTDKTYRDTTENMVKGTVTSALTMGSTTHIKLRPIQDCTDIISLTVPTHFAHLNNAEVGSEMLISVHKSAIHLMPCQ